MIQQEETLWFAMRVTYRREQSVYNQLTELGLKCFLPMQYCLQTKRGQKKRVLVPVVHNLLFVNSKPSVLQDIKQSIPHLQYITDSRSHAKIVVPEDQMQRFIAVAGTYNEQLTYVRPEEVNFKRGSKVRISGGEFEGMEGTFVKIKGSRDKRVVVSIEGVVAVALATIHPDLIELIPE